MRLDEVTIFKLLGEKGMDKKDLSKASGLTYNFILLATKGDVNCRPTTVYAIATALGVDVEDIIKRSE